MFEVQFLVPLADNEGTEFPESVFRQWEAELLDSFGGYSRYPGQVAGGWADEEGTIYRDENAVYGVAIAGMADGEEVVKAARFAKKLFRQEAIFIRYLGQTEIVS